MLVSFDFLLSMAIKGDALAAEAIDTIFSAAQHGLEANIFFSFSGKSVTLKFFKGA